MEKKTFFDIVVLILLGSFVSAEFYPYGVEAPVDSSGYIKPYQKSGVLGTYAYLEYRRYGYPKGDTFPLPLVEGTTFPLPWGLENVYLKVTVNDITDTGVDLDVDTSQIVTSTTTSIATTTTVTVTTTSTLSQTTTTSTVYIPPSAKFYEYDVESKIIVGGEELGYIKPYQKGGVLGTYVYLKYKRYGYPEGNTYPTPLMKGVTLPLPFGLENIYLKVKLYDARETGVYMDVDTSQIIASTTSSIYSTTTSTVPASTTSTTTVPLPSTAKFVKFDEKSPVVSGGVELGYIQPYLKGGVLGTYAYLKYKREGFPEGDTFPIPLSEGGTISLPFGLENVYLRVKVYRIQDDGVYLEANASEIFATTLPTTTTTISVPSSAKLYKFGVKEGVFVSGQQLGYVEPYQQSGPLGTFSYLKYRREGFPEGNTFPIPLTAGTPLKLPFGLDNVYLNVNVYSSTTEGIYLDVSLPQVIEVSSSTSSTTLPIPENARFYKYDSFNIVSEYGKGLGYFTPYKKEGVFGSFAYLKYKRDPFPEGNTFPIPLTEGYPMMLPYGTDNRYLKVNVYRVLGDGVWLDVKMKEVVPGLTEGLKDADKFLSQLTERLDKWANRGYYSSLHIVGSKAMKADSDVSSEIEEREKVLSEGVGDAVLPLLINAGGPGFAGLYCGAVRQISPSIRSQVTGYLMNIESFTDAKYPSDEDLADDGAFTIYVGGPAVNSVSYQMNEDLKSMNLPHFERKYDTWIIVSGEREYRDGGVGIIAAIPEEKVWDDKTIQKRWDAGKYRFYKTMVAGIEKEGTEAAGRWYNDQLSVVQKALMLLRNAICFAEVTGESADVQVDEGSGDVFKSIKDVGTYASQQKQTTQEIQESNYLSTLVLLNSWTLASLNTVQGGEYKIVDSAGYAVIVQEEGGSYKVLEIHSIMGEKVVKVI